MGWRSAVDLDRRSGAVMRPDVGTSIALGASTASWSLSMLPLLLWTSGNTTILSTLVSTALLFVALWGVLSGNEPRYIIGAGGMLAWTACTCSFLEGSLILTWSVLFLHLAILLIGTRGMWLRTTFTTDDDPNLGLVLRNLMSAYEWLGASAVVSGIFLVLIPFFTIPGGSVALLAILSTTAIISFAILARRFGAVLRR